LVVLLIGRHEATIVSNQHELHGCVTKSHIRNVVADPISERNCELLLLWLWLSDLDRHLWGQKGKGDKLKQEKKESSHSCINFWLPRGYLFMSERGYRIIKVTPGKIEDKYPYSQPPPYGEEPGSRRQVALDSAHPSSQAAHSQICQRANSIKTVVLIFERALAQVDAAAAQNQS
jgi:hypothetical protein